jgi:hypothetical protein
MHHSLKRGEIPIVDSVNAENYHITPFHDQIRTHHERAICISLFGSSDPFPFRICGVSFFPQKGLVAAKKASPSSYTSRMQVSLLRHAAAEV